MSGVSVARFPGQSRDTTSSSRDDRTPAEGPQPKSGADARSSVERALAKVAEEQRQEHCSARDAEREDDVLTALGLGGGAPASAEAAKGNGSSEGGEKAKDAAPAAAERAQAIPKDAKPDAAAAGEGAKASASSTSKEELNPWVLAVVKRYTSDYAGKGYQWSDDPHLPAEERKALQAKYRHWPRIAWCGNIETLEYKGVVISNGHPEQKSFCCGMGFEIFMKAYEAWCKEKGHPFEIAGLDLKESGGGFSGKLEELRKRFFVMPSADEVKAGRTDSSPWGCAYGVAEAGIGEKVAFEEAKPGDFMQYWNQKVAGGFGGHSMIVTKKVGNVLEGWSTQPWTKGVGVAGKYLRSQVSIGRVYVPSDAT